MKPILIIDPGHGGRDPGGGSSIFWDPKGFYERDMVLEISRYQYKRLKELGVPVELTRDTDVTLDPTPRTDRVKQSSATYCISNHINAASNTSARGVETIHSIHGNDKLSRAIFDAIVAEGMPGRRVFTRTLPDSPAKDYYFMHRLTGSVKTVIVEYGFATNPEDARVLGTSWQRYAESVVRAFCGHIDHPYAPKSEAPADLSPWAVAAHEWAVVAGITDGTRPGDPVTREEVWTMLYRALGK